MSFWSDMAGNVLSLLFFSALVLILYYLIPRKFRSFCLFAINFLFYLCCDWRMLPLLYGTVLMTWLIGKRLETQKKKSLLVLGIAVTAGLLFFFKYANYFADTLCRIFSGLETDTGSGVFHILVPLGISYYIFKQISYLADIYTGKIPAEHSFLLYANYVTLFTEILSGPISRFRDFQNSCETGMIYSREKFQLGFYMILKGLFMKLVIANRLSGYTSAVFADPNGFPSLALWMAAFFYAIQLYCDFGGYSAIAIGISQFFGLHFQENFRRPYFSTDIHAFWKRWHISLSSWLKDYIYIPLGGSRCSSLRRACNVILVFLVSGMWHGAGMTFLFWGLFHGILSILTPRTKGKKGLGKFFSILLNFCLVVFGWIFFRSASMAAAFAFLKHMFVGFSLSVAEIQQAVLPFTGDNTSVAMCLIAGLMIAVLFFRELYEEKKDLTDGKCGNTSLIWQIFLLSSVILLGKFGAAGFIYANF